VLLRFGLAVARCFLWDCLNPDREAVSSPRHFKPIVSIFQQWAYLLASDQGLCARPSWLAFR
jgi:hypothetical protein